METYPQRVVKEKLEKIASTLVSNGKGILCADESLCNFSFMLRAICLENTKEIRRKYRHILFTTPGLSQFISGVLLSTEAVRQKANNGTPFPELLNSKNILPGVTVDTGFLRIPLLNEEWVANGLDDLSDRCKQYRKLGCRFTNWRCGISVNKINPSSEAININAITIAKYATIVQAERLVPIVETELIMVGSNHTLERSKKVFETVLACIFKALQDYNVYLEGILLRVSMVLPGDECKLSYTSQEIAEATLSALQRTVPPAVAGITFLSGYQLALEATENLDAINNIEGRKPWPLTFNFSRPLQAIVLVTWIGREDLVQKGQEELHKRAKANSAASLGNYMSDLLNSEVTKSLIWA